MATYSSFWLNGHTIDNVEEYFQVSGDGTWATDVEIFALSHILGICMYAFDVYYRDTAHNMITEINLCEMGIYLNHQEITMRWPFLFHRDWYKVRIKCLQFQYLTELTCLIVHTGQDHQGSKQASKHHHHQQHHPSASIFKETLIKSIHIIHLQASSSKHHEENPSSATLSFRKKGRRRGRNYNNTQI